MRVMVCEDDFLLAECLVNFVRHVGHDISACVGSVDDALESIKLMPPDFAIVDLKLRDGMAYAVLEQLERHNIPFVLATNVASTDIPHRYTAHPCVFKPYSPDQLRAAIGALFDSGSDAKYDLTGS